MSCDDDSTQGWLATGSAMTSFCLKFCLNKVGGGPSIGSSVEISKKEEEINSQL